MEELTIEQKKQILMEFVKNSDCYGWGVFIYDISKRMNIRIEHLEKIYKEFKQMISDIQNAKKHAIDFAIWLLQFDETIDLEWYLEFISRCSFKYFKTNKLDFSFSLSDLKTIQKKLKYLHKNEENLEKIRQKNKTEIKGMRTYVEGYSLEMKRSEELRNEINQLEEMLRNLKEEKKWIDRVAEYEMIKALHLICALSTKKTGRNFTFDQIEIDLKKRIRVGGGGTRVIYCIKDDFVSSEEIRERFLRNDLNDIDAHYGLIAYYDGIDSTLGGHFYSPWNIFISSNWNQKDTLLHGSVCESSYVYPWINSPTYDYILKYFDYCTYWLLSNNILHKTGKVYDQLFALIDPFLEEYRCQRRIEKFPKKLEYQLKTRTNEKDFKE